MVVQSPIALARVVVNAPGRRIDLALPEQVPLVRLLEAVLRYASVSTSEGSQAGWELRRSDGSRLDLDRSLAAQNVTDGTVLHLLPTQTEWPELEYDDLVEAIATGSGRRGGSWTPSATRLTGLIATTVTLLVGLATILQLDSSRRQGAIASLATAAALWITGVLLSRALRDSVAGVVLGAVAVPYAFAGGLLIVADPGSLRSLGAPHILLGSAAALLFALLGYLGIADGARVFVAAILTSAFGTIGAALAVGPLDGLAAAGTVLSVLALFVPGMPVIALRFGKIPLPAPPRNAQDLLRDDPQPSRAIVDEATARTDEILTGLLLGTFTCSIVCFSVLAAAHTIASILLVAVVGAGFLLHSRLLLTIRQRLPLLAAGLFGLMLLPVVAAACVNASIRLVAVLPASLLAGCIALASGLTYSRRPPSPRLGRWADTLGIALQLAIVPVACSVLGLYSLTRAVNG